MDVLLEHIVVTSEGVTFIPYDFYSVLKNIHSTRNRYESNKYATNEDCFKYYIVALNKQNRLFQTRLKMPSADGRTTSLRASSSLSSNHSDSHHSGDEDNPLIVQVVYTYTYMIIIFF